ncbi:general substrate transporter [Dacryopinax primogenitus]|uniref:General substrate transporter n=1 Tax=Dacryopinax primogenitus (strain DJM 731) TaxID=1858805 RepID=M5GAT4_DACPD|nr:general substrate transporter [Dacryopinax primogenitus]EJU03087.1 general substrate transporter [Dacryopinax primogenitus]
MSPPRMGVEQQTVSRTFSTLERHAKSISDDEVDQHKPRLRGWTLHIVLAFCAGAGFTLFGYDQGVMSALITANQFDAIFPQTVSPINDPTGQAATLQSLMLAIYEIGCLIGALSNLWIGDKLGRRKTIVLGGCIMIIGATLQATAFSYPHMLVGRIVTGMGNGLNTSTVPSYHAECASPERRGPLIMVEGSLIIFGLMISYVSTIGKWVDFACYWATGSQAQWRVPIALQIVIAMMMMCGIPFLPESPRWLVKHGRNAEALAVISALEDTDRHNPRVVQTYAGICEAVEAELEGSSKEKLSRLFQGGPTQNFRRTMLGIVNQCFQQITGCNLVMYGHRRCVELRLKEGFHRYYATLLFQRLGLSDVNSRIVAACSGTEYWLASLIPIFIIERVGRRRLMLLGAIGMGTAMVLLAILGSINTPAAQIASTVLLFVYNSFFAIGWLGMTWLYPAEIVGISIRAPANALSTASNWTFNFMVVMVTGPSFANIQWRTYIVFAALNALIVPCVYFFFPETAGRSLEDMDIIFAVAYAEGVSPVQVSFRKDLPVAGSPEADEVLGLKKRGESPDVREDREKDR